MFKQASVRKPKASLVEGISSNNLGKPDFEIALIQHHEYCKALEKCGLSVLEIPSLSEFGLTKEDFPVLVEKAKVASSMKGNPVELTDEQLFRILERSL